MLTFDNVRFQYAVEDFSIIDHLSFDGEFVSIIGASGCGKSTIFRLVNKLLTPASGVIRVDGESIETKKNYCGYMPQQDLLFPWRTVRENLMLPMEIQGGYSKEQMQKKADDALRSVGLADWGDKTPKELSGGMRQRVMIAMAIINHPAILIADEPTTALDVTIQAQILDIMRRLKGSSGSLMLITHNLGIVAEICEEVVVMYAGRAIERGTLKAIFDNPLHPYTQGLMASVPTMRSEKKPLYTIPGTVPTVYDFKEGCRFADRCQHCTEECRTKIPPVKRVGEDHIVQCWMNFEGEEPYHE